MDNNKIAIFQKKEIRKILYQNEWWFSVVDVVGALTDSADSKDYWYRIKKRASAEEGAELSTICRQLKLQSADGKKYATDCANTEGGKIAGDAKKALEKKTGKAVSTQENYLIEPEHQKRIKGTSNDKKR